MTTQPVRWLYEELPKLVRGGVLDAAAADRLKHHYGPPPRSPWRKGAMVLLGTLGALLVGGGITLLFAHNWDMLSRPTRAALSFALLITAQMIALFAVWKRSDSQAWCEGAAVFLSGAVVASMALLTQIYQLGWAVESILLGWTLLTVPLAYSMRSRSAGVLVWAGSTFWLYGGMWREVNLLRGLAYLGLVALVVPFMVHLIRRHPGEGRTLLLNWAATLAFLMGSLRIVSDAGYSWRLVLAGLSGLFLLLGRVLQDRAGDTWWRNPFRTLGVLGSGFLLFLFAFRNVWSDGIGMPDDGGTVGLFAVGLALCGVALYSGYRMLQEKQYQEASLALPAALALAGLAAARLESYASIMAILSNLAVLAVGLAHCFHGFRHQRPGTVNGGLILLLAVFLARFLDLDLTFLVRGVAFIVVGAGFLAVNGWLYRRSRQEVAP